MVKKLIEAPKVRREKRQFQEAEPGNRNALTLFQAKKSEATLVTYKFIDSWHGMMESQ